MQADWANYHHVAMGEGSYALSPVGAPPALLKRTDGFFSLKRLAQRPDALPDSAGFKKLEEEAQQHWPQDSWKVHLSVHAEHVAQAWDAIVGLLLEKGISAKVVAPEGLEGMLQPMVLNDKGERRQNPQQGKMITLFRSRQPDGTPDFTPAQWQDILAQLEQRLIDAKCLPGAAVPTDRKIPGAFYSYYRAAEQAPDALPQQLMANRQALLALAPEQRYNPQSLDDAWLDMALPDAATRALQMQKLRNYYSGAITIAQ
jgi:hypothetical protein